MPVELVHALFLGLVAFAKTDQVGRHHAVACSQKGGQHAPVQVAPGRVAVQAQPGARGIPGPLVEGVQTQARQAGQVADVVRRPGVAGHVGKRRIGRAQSVVAQRMAGQCLGALLMAALAEKAAEQTTTFFGQHPALHLGLVVDLGMAEQVEHRACRARLGICRTVHHPRQPRMQHGAAAHGTRLQRDVEAAAVEPVVGEPLRRRAQGHDLGVGRGVVALHGGIAARGDDLAVLDHDGAHRHLTGAGGVLRLGQSQAHPVRILVEGHCY
ncbi:hypothetical protein D3C71_1147950 [compost metagenome]